MARQPVATFPTAALVVGAVIVLLEVAVAEPEVELAEVFDTVLVERVPLAATLDDGLVTVLAEVWVLLILVKTVLEAMETVDETDEVELLLLEAGVEVARLVLLNPVPEAMEMVVVEAVLVKEDEEELEPDRPVMWNGKEYWKIDASLSFVIVNP